MTRRLFLSLSAAAAASANRSWPMGACTAIDGYSLEASRRTVRELGFPVVEIQCIGEIVARPGKYPGFQFDQLTAAQKKQISGELRGFRRVTAHLPYTGLNYMHADPAQRAASVRTLEVAMEGAGHFGARVAVLHPSRFLPTKWGPVGTSISTASAPGVHPQVGATINVGHQKTYEELVARIKPEQRGTPEGIRAYNDTTLDIIERLGRRGHFFTVPLAVGLPTICQVSIEAAQFGGFAPATPGFNAFGQTGSTAGRAGPPRPVRT